MNVLVIDFASATKDGDNYIFNSDVNAAARTADLVVIANLEYAEDELLSGPVTSTFANNDLNGFTPISASANVVISCSQMSPDVVTVTVNI